MRAGGEAASFVQIFLLFLWHCKNINQNILKSFGLYGMQWDTKNINLS
jgi:hypothetical protein